MKQSVAWIVYVTVAGAFVLINLVPCGSVHGMIWNYDKFWGSADSTFGFPFAFMQTEYEPMNVSVR